MPAPATRPSLYHLPSGGVNDNQLLTELHIRLPHEAQHRNPRARLDHIVRNDRYPLSPRIVALKETLGMLRPEPELDPPPPRRYYEPPSKGRYRRRG